MRDGLIIMMRDRLLFASAWAARAFFAVMVANVVGNSLYTEVSFERFLIWQKWTTCLSVSAWGMLFVAASIADSRVFKKLMRKNGKKNGYNQ